MGVKVDLMAEILNRLNAAIQSGGALEGVKRVMIGSLDETRREINNPHIRIQLLGGHEIPDHPNKMYSDEMRFQIVVIDNKIKSETNQLFDISTSTGALFLLETVLNVLDKTTDGVVDNTIGGAAGYITDYTYNVQTDNDSVAMEIELAVRTKPFFKGAR